MKAICSQFRNLIEISMLSVGNILLGTSLDSQNEIFRCNFREASTFSGCKEHT